MEKTLSFRGHEFKIWYVEDYATHPTWYTFEDEKDVREAWWDPQEGDVVFDVGACCGSYTLTALACGAEVVAWAPGKLQEGLEEHEILFRSVQLNEGFENRFSVFNSGLYSGGDGWLDTGTLEYRPLLATETSVSLHAATTIFVEPLDQLGFSKVDWIKIDVEGAELEVLRGARETIERCRPKVLVEHHLFVRRTMLQEVAQFFNELGGYRFEGQIRHPASDVVHGLYVPVVP